MTPVSSDPAVFSEPYGHLLRFDGPGHHPAASLVSFIAHGVSRGEGVLVITTPLRRSALVRAIKNLGLDPVPVLREGRLLFFDAPESLAAIAPDHRPDWERFDELAGLTLRELHARFGSAGVRAYGDIVGLLWKAGRYSAAARLEDFWNRLRDEIGFSLYCAYPIDIFSREFHMASVDSFLCAHTHLLPACNEGQLEHAVNQAMDEVLADRADGLKSLMKANFRPSWPAVPRGMAMILWLRNNLGLEADRIVSRARRRYRALEKHKHLLAGNGSSM